MIAVEKEHAVAALGALAHTVRLDLVSILVRSGSKGMASGDIAVRLGVGPALASFHLRQLLQAGLLTQRRKGRHKIYVADRSAILSLLNHLGTQCCNPPVDREGRVQMDVEAW